MTDIKLLPLPEPNGSYTNPYDSDDLTNYALANVLHHTAPLRYALDKAALASQAVGVKDGR